MTSQEFLRWFDHHRACFPGVDRALARIESAHRKDDSALSVEAVLGKWRSCLSDVSLDDAIAASDAMNRGEVDEPRFFDAHARAIRIAAKGSAHVKRKRRESVVRQPTYFDGEPVYTCTKCNDEGTLLVWSFRSVEAVRAGVFLAAPFTRYSEAVRCRCAAGDRFARFLVPFDSERMMRCSRFPTDEEASALVEFLAGTVVSVDPF